LCQADLTDEPQSSVTTETECLIAQKSNPY
jgi:hypothetical protein